jgi:hypothetical protein
VTRRHWCPLPWPACGTSSAVPSNSIAGAANIWNKAERELERRRPGSTYEVAYDRALRILRTLRGRMTDPAKVAEVIGDALTAGHPKNHYRVGLDAGPVALANQLLPASVKDVLGRTVLGLGRRTGPPPTAPSSTG